MSSDRSRRARSDQPNSSGSGSFGGRKAKGGKSFGGRNGTNATKHSNESNLDSEASIRDQSQSPSSIVHSERSPMSSSAETSRPAMEANETIRNRPDQSPKTKLSYQALCEQWAPYVNAGSLLEKKLQAIGLEPKYYHTIQHQTHQHAVSAAVRENLTAAAFAEFLKQGKLRVCSLYSSPRDHILASKIARLGSHGDMLTIFNYRPIVTSQDTLRTSEAQKLITVQDISEFDAYLAVDVYETELGPFSPAVVYNLLADKPKAVLQWIGHRFAGPAGVVFNEGAWKRMDNGKIRMKPDAVSSAYSDHDPLDWMWTQDHQSFGLKSVAWAMKRSIGSFVQVVFSIIDTPSFVSTFEPVAPHWTVKTHQLAIPRDNRVSKFLSSVCVTAGLHLNHLIFRALGISRQVKFLVPTDLWQALKHAAANRHVNANLYRTLAQAVRANLEAHPSATCFYTRFPEETPSVEALTLTLLTEDIESKALMLGSANLSFGSSINFYNQEMSALDHATPPVRPWKTYGILLGVLLVFIRYWLNNFKPQQPGSVLLLLWNRLSYGRLRLRAIGLLLRYHLRFLGDRSLVIWNAFLLKAHELIITYPRIAAFLQSWTGSFMVTQLSTMLYSALRRYSVYARIASSIVNEPHPGANMVAQYVYTLAYSAPLEETIKHLPKIGAPLSVGIVVAEAYHHILNGTLGSYIPAAIMHSVCYHLPLIPATAIHFVWNMLTLSSNILPPGSLRLRWLIPLLCCALLYVFPWRRQTLPSKWLAFKRAYYEEVWEHRPPINFLKTTTIEDVPPFALLTSTQQFHGSVPLQRTRMIPINPKDLEAMKFSKVVDETKRRDMVFNILHLGVPLYAPANSDYNRWAVMVTRILAAPPMEQEEQIKAWKEQFHLPAVLDNSLSEFTDDFIYSTCNALTYEPDPFWWLETLRKHRKLFTPLPPIPFSEWLKHLDSSKRRRMQDAHDQISSQGMAIVQEALRSVKLMVKKDEVLMKFSDDDLPQMKPRAIANVNPIIAAHIGPHIYAAQKLLGEIWPAQPEFAEHVITKAGVTPFRYYISITSASGLTDTALSDWWAGVQLFSQAIDVTVPVVAIIVGGDDGLIAIRYKGVWMFIESDMSMYDQSQQIGPLAFEWCFLKAMGISEEILILLSQLSQAKYVMFGMNSKDPIRVTIPRTIETIRDTGGTDTTFGNTSNTGHASHFVVRQMLLFLSEHLAQDRTLGLYAREGFWEEQFAILGFKAKVKIHWQIEDATFLKGMWYPCKHETYSHFWGPLPSRIIKAVKSLKDPRVIYKVKDYPEACRLFMHDMAKCYQSFVAVPVLRCLNTFIIPDRKQVHDYIGQHKITADAGPKPQLLYWDTLQQLSSHYNVDPNKIVEFEDQFPRKLFVFFDHMLAVAMAKRDYS